MADNMSEAPAIDFDAAEKFLRQAREARDAGDGKLCSACLKLVKVALGMTDMIPPRFKTGHLA